MDRQSSVLVLVESFVPVRTVDIHTGFFAFIYSMSIALQVIALQVIALQVPWIIHLVICQSQY